MPNIPHPRDIPRSFQELQAEFDRLLDRVWHGGLRTAPLDGQDWAPSIEVLDEGDRYRVRAEVPGLTGDDVSISILGDTLTIKGTKPCRQEGDAEHRYLRAECSYGSFCRRYEFPAAVQEEGATASCRNGVLEIVIRKTAQAKGRTIRVESED